MNDASAVIEAYKKTAARLLADPDSPEDLCNQFALLAARGERTPAHLVLARRCAASAPKEWLPLFNLGSAEMRAGLYKDSLRSFSRALDVAPPDRRAITLHHIGMAWHDLGEHETALTWYMTAQFADPTDKEIEQSVAITKLASGELESGLYDFEVRLHKPPRKNISNSGIPRWRGEDLAGRTLILAHEQGYGDSLQFIRFAPELRKLGVAKLIWSGPPGLNGLIADNFAFDAVVDEAGPFEADFVTSPMAACGILGATYADMTGEPYMTAPPAMQLPGRGKLKVGLSWKGSPGYAADAKRSMRLEDLGSLLELPGAAFYSLQVGKDAADITRLGLDGFVADLGSVIHDWRDTARAVAAMDVIVTVDTANGHLAGALGKPVLLLLADPSCWRWMSKRTDTPWYRAHRLFRQTTPENWAEPVAAVRSTLEAMLASG